MHPAADYFPAKPHKGRCCVRICLPEDPPGRGVPVVLCTVLAGIPEDPQTFDLVALARHEVEGVGGYMDEGQRRVGEPN